jgi:Tol biopolymer transport system component
MIEELSTSSNEGDPWLSPDEDHILFASDALGDTDVVEAFR